MDITDEHKREIKVIYLENTITKLQKDRFQHSEIYHKITRIICSYKKTLDYVDHFDQSDWILIFNYWWPDYYFPKHLSEKYPNLSESEILLCCLIKLGFSNVEIGILLERTRDSIYKKCAAICRKMADIPVESSLREILEKIDFPE